MLTIAVLLFGMVSLSRLQVTLLPDLSYPTLTIRTELTGAAPTEVETLLSKPVEEALGVIKGVRRVSSVSRAGQGDVTLEFEWGTEMDFAVLDVREKLDALELPKEVVRPIVLRFDPSQDPILRLGLALKPREGAAPAVADETLAPQRFGAVVFLIAVSFPAALAERLSPCRVGRREPAGRGAPPSESVAVVRVGRRRPSRSP